MCHLYFGLHWVCVAVCGLSLVVVSGVCAVWASHCVAPLVVEHGL